jgi:hypothetical protein
MRDLSEEQASTLGGRAGGLIRERDMGEGLRSVSEQPLLEEIGKRIAMATARLTNIAEGIEDQGTRLFGPRGETASDEKIAKIDPQGAVDHLFVALGALDQAIDRTRGAHARISRV